MAPGDGRVDCLEEILLRDEEYMERLSAGPWKKEKRRSEI